MEKCTADTQPTLNETVCEAIALALIRLMERKPFEKISVTEIVRLAGVGRTTFYRNFRDKEQVLCRYINDLYLSFYHSGKMPACDSASGGIEAFLLPRFQFIKEQRSFFMVLRRHHLLHEAFSQINADMLLYISGVKAPANPYRLAALSGSCAEIIRLWIDNDFAERPEELTDVFLDICRQGQEI